MGGDLVVVGLHGAVLGVGQTARLFSRALQQAGVEAISLDVSPLFGLDNGLWPSPARQPAEGGVVISHLNPPELLEWLRRGGARVIRRRRHIGYWVWELPDPPPTWRAALPYVDEIWCPSEFAARSLRRLDPSMTVRVVPPPVAASLDGRRMRARFDLPDQAIVVLSVLDFRSTAARKNPRGALQIVEHARTRGGASAIFVCKVTGLDAPGATEALAELRAAADVRIVEAELTEQEMADLIASADILLSAHRSEGFGLVLAEAMLAGRCVCATGWSGNIDFMSARNSVLLPFSLTPVVDPSGVYAGSTWAEPMLETAGEQLGALLDNPSRSDALGAEARKAILSRFDPVVWASRVVRLARTGAAE